MKLSAGPALGLCLLVLSLLHNVSGGNLRTFAEEATSTPAADSKNKSTKNSSGTDTIANSSFGTGTYPAEDGGESFLEGFYAWLVTAPFEYRQDDPSGSLADGEDGAMGRRRLFPQHLLGEATVPYVRVDYNWQSIDSDIDADDFRIELGYKLLAFHGRATQYKDQSDGFELDIEQYYGVVRYGGYRPDFLPGTFEAGIGLGMSRIKTNDSTIGDESGTALTFPLKYYPVQWFGVEFRPAWYTFVEKRVGDYDGSVSFGYRYLQIRGGYRWMTLQGSGTFNDGPYAGLSLSF